MKSIQLDVLLSTIQDKLNEFTSMVNKNPLTMRSELNIKKKNDKVLFIVDYNSKQVS